MKTSIILSLLFGVTLLSGIPADEQKVSVASIKPGDLVEYEDQPESVKRLIEVSLGYTEKNLGYRFGSNSPKNKGMDCSGTVQCVLMHLGLEKVPRSSWNFYEWAAASGDLIPTEGATSTKDDVFADLNPGDLLFWEGTYETGERVPAISHVMIFLGTLREDGAGVVFGASSGRRYRGKTIHGVSVFDWVLPGSGSTSKFVGYAPVPGLREKSTDEDDPSSKQKGLKSMLESLLRKSEASPP